MDTVSLNMSLNIPNNYSKQLQQVAQANLIKQYGMLAFTKLPLIERMRLRNEECERILNPVISASPNYGEFGGKHNEQLTPSREFSDKFDGVDKEKQKLIPEPHGIHVRPLMYVQGQEAKEEIEIKIQKKHETFSLDIQLNAQQTLAAEYAESGKCFVLTGPAGTGKTTACREIAKRLLKSGKLREHDFKAQGGERVFAPSIAFCSYTNRATNNMARALHKDPELEEALSVNVLTIHKLLEYEPVFYEIQNEKGDWYTTMRFEPQRTARNPLKITHLIIEEASMLDIDLGQKLLSALPANCQIIYVGDINQLPPVFGKSMLNYALINLPVVELTEVYRQALESPIIRAAHAILAGKEPEEVRPLYQIVSGKNLKRIPTESGCVNQLVNSLESWFNTYEEGSRKYDPEQDIILCPWNKGEAGTNVLNAHISGFLGRQRGELVYEVFAGMQRLYLSKGDRVMFMKQDGYITNIRHNGVYLGRMPRPASSEMTRFGIMLANKEGKFEDLELELTAYASLNVDNIPDNDEKEKKQASSHIVEVTLDSGQVVLLDSAGHFGQQYFSLAYALTIHKAQGCEWRKVFILMHKAHAISLNREMIYTATTRAREFCITVDLCNILERSIQTQRCKGNTIQEKIESFNAETSLDEPVPVVP